MAQTIRWDGLNEAIDTLRRVAADADKTVGGALHREAERIMTLSKRDFVPVDLGTLRASGHVRPPETHGTVVSVTMGYGGAAKAYAVVQHERLDFRHPRGGQAKYLEAPVMQEARNVERNVGRTIADYLRRRT